jgi:hypothetical protein
MSIGHRFKRHPIAMATHFRHSLVLAYALPAGVLAPLVPPGLRLDTYGEHGFVAVALVSTERLRPQGLPAALGRDYVLTGYRIFVRHHDATGRMRRGLHILRSDTDRRSMVIGGNALTHYNYRRADIRFDDRGDALEVEIRTPGAEADLHVLADLGDRGDPAGPPAPLPAGSPFAGTTDARRFAGPLPWTFDHEPETRSIVMIRGHRSAWLPRPVVVEVKELTFLDDDRFAGAPAVLANAFHVADIDYRWERGVRVPLAS